ncbi:MULTISPECIES: mechanosensitive ion channel domain-containing protein [unclassified Arenibacter]|jgi:small-conductance mechanosensitive channel|uniref:mechanosensitive ion channel domain-containing protein n=1 Tax=unclassified Arenibacter TaxID=2615047 RepID=UPI000E357B78|nr:MULTISPECIES: mechanosensitive ion channel domain-containing protein [unclassified Arenibacter]MCK0135442.1 mechanosensitive ion channel family protein [Arenibacter sp. S6351L]MCM4162597.1 mechanosensitive ion channel protein MscS [Arenibacter sp. A80]RFT58173.1 mechanosensitive ion channel family protein [Arenibacter sp. P308M17]|tara:strand:+ start:1536 stop:2033 length:498 start_codon:yes stop_codon:yes gene_type:complete
MENTQLKIIETAAVVIGFVLLFIMTAKLVDKTVSNSLLKKARGKIIKKAINIINLTVCIIIILIIWGVDQSELAVFVGSTVTILGIAMFAQWSILSNITSGIIIFFNHPVKLEDTISIMDKDYEIVGRVSDIGLFFIILKTNEGEQITIPSNVFIQKMIKKKING